ncbi:MAG: 4'-phosphopantetheinyl transferase family protein [Akkermansia sp.]
MDYAFYRLNALPPADLSLLDEGERERAARSNRSGFAAVRCLLKRELARRAGCEPGEVHLVCGPHGKPLFPPQPFNISHAGGWLALAFHGAEVGIDIEAPRPLRNRAAMARRIMEESQWRAFCQRGCPEREFFLCWCIAEALVKWAGDSVLRAQQFPFELAAGRVRPLFSPAPVVELLSPPDGLCGAIAYSPL